MVSAKYHSRCYTCCESIIPGDTIGVRRVRGGRVSECLRCARRAAARVAERKEFKRGAVAAARGSESRT